LSDPFKIIYFTIIPSAFIALGLLAAVIGLKLSEKAESDENVMLKTMLKT